jgi:multiple antibiotic resistance protein
LLLSAPRVLNLFGETGANVVSRLLGVILSALAVQYVVNGVAGAFGDMPMPEIPGVTV